MGMTILSTCSGRVLGGLGSLTGSGNRSLYVRDKSKEEEFSRDMVHRFYVNGLLRWNDE